MTLMGLPHSEISGSKRACRSPKHIVACHVLHRLSVPRHSPSTLSNLTIKCLDLMRSAVESYGFTLHFFNYNPYSIVNELQVAKTNAEPESRSGFALTVCLAASLFLSAAVPATTRHMHNWWSWTGSNRRPPACKAGALPTELQSRSRLRLE